MYIFLQNVSTMNISNPIFFLSHVGFTIVTNDPPPPREDNHRAQLHCKQLLARPFGLVFEMSQSLAFIGQLK